MTFERTFSAGSTHLPFNSYQTYSNGFLSSMPQFVHTQPSSPAHTYIAQNYYPFGNPVLTNFDGPYWEDVNRQSFFEPFMAPTTPTQTGQINLIDSINKNLSLTQRKYNRSLLPRYIMPNKQQQHPQPVSVPLLQEPPPYTFTTFIPPNAQRSTRTLVERDPSVGQSQRAPRARSSGAIDRIPLIQPSVVFLQPLQPKIPVLQKLAPKQSMIPKREQPKQQQLQKPQQQKQEQPQQIQKPQQQKQEHPQIANKPTAFQPFVKKNTEISIQKTNSKTSLLPQPLKPVLKNSTTDLVKKVDNQKTRSNEKLTVKIDKSAKIHQPAKLTSSPKKSKTTSPSKLNSTQEISNKEKLKSPNLNESPKESKVTQTEMKIKEIQTKIPSPKIKSPKIEIKKEDKAVLTKTEETITTQSNNAESKETKENEKSVEKTKSPSPRKLSWADVIELKNTTSPLTELFVPETKIEQPLEPIPESEPPKFIAKVTETKELQHLEIPIVEELSLVRDTSSIMFREGTETLAKIDETDSLEVNNEIERGIIADELLAEPEDVTLLIDKSTEEQSNEIADETKNFYKDDIHSSSEEIKIDQQNMITSDYCTDDTEAELSPTKEYCQTPIKELLFESLNNVLQSPTPSLPKNEHPSPRARIDSQEQSIRKIKEEVKTPPIEPVKEIDETAKTEKQVVYIPKSEKNIISSSVFYVNVPPKPKIAEKIEAKKEQTGETTRTVELPTIEFLLNKEKTKIVPVKPIQLEKFHLNQDEKAQQEELTVKKAPQVISNEKAQINHSTLPKKAQLNIQDLNFSRGQLQSPYGTLFRPLQQREKILENLFKQSNENSPFIAFDPKDTTGSPFKLIIPKPDSQKTEEKTTHVPPLYHPLPPSYYTLPNNSLNDQNSHKSYFVDKTQSKKNSNLQAFMPLLTTDQSQLQKQQQTTLKPPIQIVPPLLNTPTENLLNIPFEGLFPSLNGEKKPSINQTTNEKQQNIEQYNSVRSAFFLTPF